MKKRNFSKLKKLSLVIIMLIITFSGCVAISNIHSKNMTTKQKVLKAVYPTFTKITKLFGKNNKILENKTNAHPQKSFYDLSVEQNNGDELSFSSLKGKKVLLVNTASDCGYTAQYDDLQKLYAENAGKLVIIGFPANDFKEQEKGTDEEIAQFCKLNYGITFPLTKKTIVIKAENQNPVFQWLSDKNLNGWNDKAPVWNFTKYLVNEDGVLSDYFEPSVSPLSSEVINAIEKQ